MKDILTSPRIMKIKRNRRMRKLRVFIFYFILSVFIILVASFFSNDKRMTINKIEITGTHIIDQVEVKKNVRNDISGKYVYLFSKANSFIYPRNKIYKDLLFNFPRIDKLSIYRDNLRTMHINISERVGSYLYCGSSVPEIKTEIGENCYFLNDDGFIFDKAPYFSGDVYFKYYMKVSNNTINPLGKQITSINNFHNLVRFIDGITSLGFKPIYIVSNLNGMSSLYLDYTPGDTTPKIIFKDDNNLSVIQDNLALAMEKKKFTNEIKSKYSKLLYIDLRFENRVLYKFSSGERK